MKCKKFELTSSVYLDGQLTESETAQYSEHLGGCEYCSRRFAEIEAASQMLREAANPAVPRELHPYVMTAVARRASGELGAAQRLKDWLLRLNPTPISYATGVVLSTLLFSLVLSGFKPIPVVEAAAGQFFVFPVITGSDQQYHYYNDIPHDAGEADAAHYYHLPRVLDNSALVSFSNIAYQKPGNDGMAALIEVEPDGRAKLVDVLQEPKDSYMVQQLWWSLSERTFQPAIVEGRPVTTRIVLLVEKVDVSG